MTHQANWPAIITIYAAALLQGATLVSFPALGTLLRELHHLSDAQYGAIFLPQVALAVVGALGGGALARHLGLRQILLLALLANALSQLLLATSTWLPGAGYPMILAATAALGAGFGLSGAPLNSYPPLFFPRHRDAAVVALHTVIGIGLAGVPLLATLAISAEVWSALPWGLVLITLALGALTLAISLPSLEGGEAKEGAEQRAVDQLEPAGEERPSATPIFWLFAAIAILYAFAEGTFSNWAVVYLEEVKGLPGAVAAWALSLFWGSLVAGRLLASLLLTRFSAQQLWLTLPGLMIAAFLLLPYANSPALGMALFAFAGLACSAFFPLTISLISARFPNQVAWVSSVMIAALMVGVGLGSFVIGSLREWLPLERLYQVSAAYPIAVLSLALLSLRGNRRSDNERR